MPLALNPGEHAAYFISFRRGWAGLGWAGLGLTGGGLLRPGSSSLCAALWSHPRSQPFWAGAARGAGSGTLESGPRGQGAPERTKPGAGLAGSAAA